MLKTIKNILTKTPDEKSGNGLYVTLEDLVEQKKYLKYVRVSKRNLSKSQHSGDVKSAFKGRGVELEESRQYIFGDDVRDIDWRLTARKQDPYTKIYNEEKDREVYVLLDVSKTMVFGTKKELKSVAAAKTAALLGWTALENKDRFGCLVYDGKSADLFKPQNSSKNVMAVFKKIADVSKAILKNSKNDIDLSRAVHILKKNVKSQPMIFVISDFNDFSDALKKSLAALAKVSSLYCIDIVDKLEEFPPKAGEYMIEDNNEKLVFNSGGKVFGREYLEYFAEKRQEIESFCKKFSIKFIVLHTDKDIHSQLNIA
ncbi:MAG: DUF58 domain-containing protein [Lactobacillus sp.]|jgi:uncharacterized protein (DUF58 family)|nr:DUF58 domain-containing protein [Lactobacillus sp.]